MVVVVVAVVVVVVAVVVVVVICSCRCNYTSVVISKFILQKRSLLIYVYGKDTCPTLWMRRLICVFTESILLYGFCCALAKTKYSTLKA